MLKTIIGAALFGTVLGTGVAFAQPRTYSVWGHDFDYPASQQDEPTLAVPNQNFRAQVDDDGRARQPRELRDFNIR
jgi:hypothetical protein